jgi:phytoene dehydrogenase-like protein
LGDLLAPPASRLLTPIKGLLLAGEDAEPLPAISGRAGRLAARRILSP